MGKSERLRAHDISPTESRLCRLVRAPKTPQGVALRAKVALSAAEEKPNNQISSELGISRPTVILWRERMATHGLEGIPLVVSRTGWTGGVGYGLYLRDGSRGDELWERVMEAGRPFAIRPIAPSEARRIGAGIFNYGSDIMMENTPLEVSGFERLVEPQQADFIGKDALKRIAAKGVQRKLVGVDIGGEPMTAEGALSDFWPVRENGAVPWTRPSPRFLSSTREGHPEVVG